MAKTLIRLTEDYDVSRTPQSSIVVGKIKTSRSRDRLKDQEIKSKELNSSISRRRLFKVFWSNPRVAKRLRNAHTGLEYIDWRDER